jgi:hypothetical protein
MPETFPPQDGSVIVILDEQTLQATGLALDTTAIIIPEPQPQSIVLAMEGFKGDKGDTGPPGEKGDPGDSSTWNGGTVSGYALFQAGLEAQKVPAYFDPPTVALGTSPAVYHGAIQIYNPVGDSGSPSLSIYKLSPDHSTTLCVVQIGVDANGVQVSTGSTPVNIIDTSGNLKWAALSGVPATFAPSAHAPSHKAAGADPIKLDELAPPTDIINLNASTSTQGLLKKLDGTPTHYLDGTGNWSTPTDTKPIWGEIPVGSINGTNVTYTTANPYSPGLLAVYLNGLRMRRANDYVETGNQSFQFLNAPLPGDSLSIDYIQTATGTQSASSLRGSLWFTGSGPPPTPLTGALPGDYYLDSTSGTFHRLS